MKRRSEFARGLSSPRLPLRPKRKDALLKTQQFAKERNFITDRMTLNHCYSNVLRVFLFPRSRSIAKGNCPEFFISSPATPIFPRDSSEGDYCCSLIRVSPCSVGFVAIVKCDKQDRAVGSKLPSLHTNRRFKREVMAIYYNVIYSVRL